MRAIYKPCTLPPHESVARSIDVTIRWRIRELIASHANIRRKMREEANHAADSGLSETMAARIDIEELSGPARQRQISDAVEALDGVIEFKIENGAVHVSYDPLATTEKKIESAIRSTGATVKAAVADTETPHPDLPTPADVKKTPVEKTQHGEQS